MEKFNAKGEEIIQLNLHDIPVKIIEAMRKILEYKEVNGRFKACTQPETWIRAALYFLEHKHKIKIK